jgi:hypothetical protein
MIERRYQMTKVRAGDYVLPGNTMEHFYRIRSYDEDGSAYRERLAADGTWKQEPVLGTFWEISHLPHRDVRMVVTLGDDIDDWGWQPIDSSHRTRAAAIEAALAHEARQS